MSQSREFDIIVFGATGYTGRLVVAQLLSHTSHLRIALAGRNLKKLQSLQLKHMPLLLANAYDEEEMMKLAQRTKVICSTVGPYAQYGSSLVSACAKAGTHYCDLSAELHWIREMIDRYHQLAQSTGAKIVHACGFDSIPSDLGTWLIQQEMIAQYGQPAAKVSSHLISFQGGISGGSFASALEIAKASQDIGVRHLLANPYYLHPDPYDIETLPNVWDYRSFRWSSGQKRFLAPFVMAPINSRIVQRSHALYEFIWGPHFIYQEMMSYPQNLKGVLQALGMTMMSPLFRLALRYPRLLESIRRFAPAPGEGPTLEKLQAGHWTMVLHAEHRGESLYYLAKDHADPGYFSTARMLSQCALSLAMDPLTTSGGILTPGYAFGEHLAERLRAIGFIWKRIDSWDEATYDHER